MDRKLMGLKENIKKENVEMFNESTKHVQGGFKDKSWNVESFHSLSV